MQRRDFLKLGLGGLTLPQVLALRAGANEGTHGFRRAKNCIVLFCWGGISHLDTFDLKPNAPSNIRGTFNEIPTTVPGIRVGEHLPGFARTMKHWAVVRGAHHNAPSHRSGAYWNLTGHQPQNLTGNWTATRADWPSIGSMIWDAKGAPANHLPGAVALDSETDARAFGDGVAALTSQERERVMLRSADWGASPRWAALADLYLLSAAGTVACAGPYAPSTFCELAAALSAVRVGLRSPRTRTGALWRSGRNASQFPALVWCPAVAREDSDDVSRRRRRRWAAAPRCCETTLLG